MPPLSEIVFRRRPRTARATPSGTRRRRRGDAPLGRAEALEPRAMLAVTSVVDELGAAGWAGAFVDVGDVPGNASVVVNAVASDSANNRYVGGSFVGKVDFDPGTAVVSKTAVDGGTGFVAKFDAAGKFLSVITLDPAAPVGDSSPGSSSVAALAISGSGKIAVAGDYTGVVDFNPSSGVNEASGIGAFAVVLGTDAAWTWQNSLIAFNDVGGGFVEAGVTHVAFVDNAPSSTNMNLYLGGWTYTQNDSFEIVNDAFILKTKFSDGDRTDWVQSLGGTAAYPAGLAATPTGVVLTATYEGGLATIDAIAEKLALPIKYPNQGGIALSLSSAGTYVPASNWLRTFEEQAVGSLPFSLGETPAVMPLAVSADGATVYLATTAADSVGSSSTLYAIKNSGTGIGANRWVKTTAELFGEKAPSAIAAQTLGLGNGNLYVGGTAIPAAQEAVPQVGLTAIDPATGALKGTAVVASGGLTARSGVVTPDGKLLFGGTFAASVQFPTFLRPTWVPDWAPDPTPPTLTNDGGNTGMFAAVANPFVIVPQFEKFSRPIAGIPDYLRFSLPGDVSSTATASDPNDTYDSGPGPVIPISAFRLTRNGADIPLTNKAIARISSYQSAEAGQPVVGREVYLDGLAALTSSPGTYVLSFDWNRLSTADKAKVTPALAGATFGTASATYTVVAPVTSVTGPKGFAAALASNGGGNFSRPMTVSDVVTDAAGLVYVAGSFSGTADFDPSSAVQNRTSATRTESSETVSSEDGFVAIYNANGSFNKVITFPGQGDVSVDQIVLDGPGKLIVAGSASGTNTGLGTSTTWSGFVLSLDTTTSTGTISNVRMLATDSTNPWQRLLITDLERDATTGVAYALGEFFGSLTVGDTTLEQGFQTPFIAAFSPSTAPGAGLQPITVAAIAPALAGLDDIRGLDLVITSNGVPVIGAVGPAFLGTEFTQAAALAGINTTTGEADWVETVPLIGLAREDKAFISLAAGSEGRVYAGVASVKVEYGPTYTSSVGPSGLVAVQVTKATAPGEGEPLSSVASLWSKTNLDIGVAGYDGFPTKISVDNAGSVYVSGDAFVAGSAIYGTDESVSSYGNGSVGSFLLKLNATDGAFDPASDLLLQPGRAAYGAFQPTNGKFVNFGVVPDLFAQVDHSVNGVTKAPSHLIVPPSLTASFFSVLSDPFAPLPPAPTLSLAAASDSGTSNSDRLTNVTTPVFGGTATAGSTVTVYAQKLVSGEPSGDLIKLGTAAATTGAWSFTTPSGKFSTGDWRVDATQTVAGDEGVAASITLAIDTVAPVKPGLPNLVDGDDTGSSPTDNLTNKSTVTLDGTAEANGSVDVFRAGTKVGSTKADGSGAWSLANVALVAGANAFTVKVTDAAGNVSVVSDTLTVTRDSTAPTTPSAPKLAAGEDTGVASIPATLADNLTSKTRPTLTGTVEANAIVDIYVNGTLDATGTASSTGLYNIKLASTLTDGSYPVTVKATDKAGNPSVGSTSLSLKIDTTAPSASAFPVTAPVAKAYKAGDTLAFSVKVTSPVAVVGVPTIPLAIGSTNVAAAYLGGSGTDTLTFRYTVVANNNGAVSLPNNEIALPTGASIKSTANGSDATRTFVTPILTGVLVDTLAPSKPGLPNLVDGDDTGSSPTDNLTNKSTVTLDGTAEANGSVDVFRAGTKVGSTAADGSGAWSLANVALVAGANAFTVKVTDAAGNVSVVSDTLTVTRDSTAPAAPSLADLITADDTGSNTADNVTSRTRPTFTGTAEAGSLVEVFATKTGESAVSLGTVPTTGTTTGWTFLTPVGKAFVDGVYAITTKTTDAAGNTSVASLPLSVTVDTSVPSASAFPVTAPVAKSYKAGDVLSFAVKFTSPVTVVGVPTIDLTIGSTLRKALYVSGSGTDTLTFRYTIVAGDNDADGIALVSTVIQLPVGASIKSSANSNDATRTFVAPDLTGVLVDTVAPVKPGLPNLVDGDDTGSSSTDNLTNKSTVTLDGTAEANGSVDVFRAGTKVGTSKADGSGAWSLASVALLAGANAFTVKVTDAAGNVSVVSDTLTVTRDSTAPAAPSLADLITADDTGSNTADNVTSRTRPTFTGTAEAGSLVEVFATKTGESAVSLGTVPTTGTTTGWTFLTPVGKAFVDGVYGITTKTTDKAGNTSVASLPLSVTIDNSSPSASAFPVTAPVAKSYKAGDVLSFAVKFTSPVTVVGVPTIDLTIGSTLRKALYLSGSGTDTLTFRYTIVAGDNDADGIALVSAVIQLPVGASIKSSANSNDATRTFVAPDLTGVLVDTVAPVKPGLPNLVDGDDTGSSSTDNLTSKSTVTLDGTAEANGSVDVFRAGTKVGTSKADGSGAWSLASVALVAGANAFTVKVTDAAGNVSVVSDALTVTRDSTAPTTPLAPKLAAGEDTGVASIPATLADNLTSKTRPTLTGTVEANAIVDIYVNGTLDATGTASSTGLYNIKLASTLTDGSYPVTVKATDKAGNPSVASLPLSVTVDTSGPTIVSIAGPLAKTYKIGDTLDFEATFGQAVTVTAPGSKPSLAIEVGTTPVQATYLSGSGTTKLKFRLTVAAGQRDTDGVIALGSLTVPTGASIQDTAGNNAVTSFSPATYLDVFVDAVVPVVDSMTTDGSTTSDVWKRTGVITFSRPVNGVSTGDFTITGFFFGATRTVRLNTADVAAVVGEVRVVPLNPVGGFASTWYLDVRKLPLQAGNYTIELVASGSGIVDQVGNSLLQNKTLILTV